MPLVLEMDVVQGCIKLSIPPPPVGGGGGIKSKGLEMGEKNKKMKKTNFCRFHTFGNSKL